MRLRPFLLLLAVPCLMADSPLSASAASAALARLQAQRAALGLGPEDDFRVRSAFRDDLGQSHARLQQTWRGVPVWGGEAIAHADAEGRPLELTDGLCRGIQVEVLPNLTPAEALALADADLAPRGPYAYPPTVTKVIYPHRSKGQPPAYLLAYHVHAQLENGREETVHRDYLINAWTGAILERWNSLRTHASRGIGVTQYSGRVTLDTARTAKGFVLRDLTRGKGGPFGNNVITNLDHDTQGNGTLFVAARDTWGDGGNYADGDTTSPNGQTAAADAAYGTQVTWDMYRNVFGRNGIDGTGKATFGRVHYATSFDNAFWDDHCFCMTYGDGDVFKSLEAMDVAGHEMSHGVCASSADLEYQGESGGLNEANSDIFGTMAEFYAQGGGFARHARTLPETGGNWTLGEQVGDKPVRYMYKPSKDGDSPDAWSEDLGDLDVHASSGPMNRCFYFLSQGAAAAAGDYHSSFLPKGMTGLGNDRAARIWYRALTAYLQSESDYAAARVAAIRAAKDLYGAGGKAEQAVWRAFHAINVGPDWGAKPAPKPTPKPAPKPKPKPPTDPDPDPDPDPGPFAARIDLPAGNLTIPSGTVVAFGASARDRAPGARLSYDWQFGDGGTASGQIVIHPFSAPGPDNLERTVTLTVTDDHGARGGATRHLTVIPARSGRAAQGEGIGSVGANGGAPCSGQ